MPARNLHWAFLTIFALFLSSCAFNLSQAQPVVQASPSAPEAQSLPTAAPPPPSPTPELRTLTVCLGQEPNTLYPFGTLNSAARSVLGAIYDGPIDTFVNGYQPVILEKIPSLKNGDAQLTPITVKRGDRVIDASGNLVALDYGSTVLPSGCSDDSCAEKFTSSSDLKMDQLVVTFRMLPNLKWSDGTPLTAQDSIYSFKLDSDANTPGSKYLVDRTQSYEATDALTVQWWGIPGFVDPSYAANFWMPLPEHTWKNLSASDLANADTAARPPVGWGAYQFVEWAKGDYIRLEKNPNYFRSAEGLPAFNTLIFRFVKDAPAGISALVAGQCDILDSSVRLDGHIDLLTDLARNDQVKLFTSTTPLMERLDFGIRPASYDAGYSTSQGDRPDLLGDVLTRQGIAFCLDRQKVVNDVLGGMSQIPDTFVPPTHSLYSQDAAKYPYDMNKGIQLLQSAGWVDADNNPETPRVAVNVKGVPAGTPLVLNYWTTSALQRQQVSQILSQSLAQCGVGVNVKYFDQDSFYAPGPDGPLFGRKFDLAEYAIAAVGSEPACSWLLADQIPDSANHWLGLNISGYSNPDFDLVCRQAMRTLPDQDAHTSAYQQAQSIFANDLPFIPLYMRIKAVAARRDICNFRLDAVTLNDLWNIEELDYKPTCRVVPE